MRYLIRRPSPGGTGGSSDSSILGNSAAALQQRGLILSFLFFLSLITTLWSLVNFHKGNNSEGRRGMVSFDYAAEVFLVNRDDSNTRERKKEIMKSLSMRYEEESERLKKLHLHRGRSTGGLANGSRMGASKVLRHMQYFYKHLQQSIPNTRQGFFVEYYDCGSDSSISLTTPLEDQYNWTGVRIYSSLSEKYLEYLTQTRNSSYIGTGFKFCQSSNTFVTHTKAKTPNSGQTPKVTDEDEGQQPVRYQNQTTESRQFNRTLKLNTPSTNIYKNLNPQRRLLFDLVNAKVRCSSKRIPCFSLFSLLHSLKTYTVDFLVIHTSRTDSDLEILSDDVFKHFLVVKIKALSILRASSHASLLREAEALKERMRNLGYEQQAIPVGHPTPVPTVASINGILHKVNGQLKMSQNVEIKGKFNNVVKHDHFTLIQKPLFYISHHRRRQ